MENSFNKNDKYFLRYQIHGKTYGFILFSINQIFVTIELIAIDRGYQKIGIGEILLNSLEDYSRKISKKVIKVGTQIENLSAINFYIKNNYKLMSCNSIYHYWNKKVNKVEEIL